MKRIGVNVSGVGREQGGAFEGEALVVWARAGGRPVFLAALLHTASPYGPFVEIVAGEFRSRPGLRPRLRQTTLAVTGGPARETGAEAASLKWWADDPLREVRWEEREFRLRAEAKTVKNRLHIDLNPDNQEAEVARLLGLGAKRADVGQSDEVRWVVMADPEGNEFCVLTPRDQ